MGKILHRCARTTEALRRAIQDNQESIAALADRYDLNPKTVHKWKRRTSLPKSNIHGRMAKSSA